MAGLTGEPESRCVEISRESDVYEARFQARQLARTMGFDAYDSAAIETAVAELSTNIYRHAGRGTVQIRAWCQSGRCRALDMVAINARAAAQPRVQQDPRREGLGIGLAGVRRLMDEFRVEFVEGRLQVSARKWLPAFRPPPAVESMRLVQTSSRYRVDVAIRPWRPGACADSYLVKEQEGRLAVLVADVLGHSEEAAEVAGLLRGAAMQLMEPIRNVRPDGLLRDLHGALRGTRGACVTVAMVEPEGRRIEWAGVGNVRARLWHRSGSESTSLLPVPGIVGYSLRQVRASAAPVMPPACLALVTDGVDEAALDRRPADAEALLRRFASSRDDATVVVVKW